MTEGVYYDSGRDITIDGLIKALQKARAEIGGAARVVVGDSDADELKGIEAVGAIYADRSGSSYEWLGNYGEDEEDGDTVLALYGRV